MPGGLRKSRDISCCFVRYLSFWYIVLAHGRPPRTCPGRENPQILCPSAMPATCEEFGDSFAGKNKVVTISATLPGEVFLSEAQRSRQADHTLPVHSREVRQSHRRTRQPMRARDAERVCETVEPHVQCTAPGHLAKPPCQSKRGRILRYGRRTDFTCIQVEDSARGFLGFRTRRQSTSYLLLLDQDARRAWLGPYIDNGRLPRHLMCEFT